jgi:formylglycine-generating enzyme required for sulfatase activity
MALEGISDSRSAFEQYHALLLMNQLMNLIDASAMPQIQSVIQDQLGRNITNQDNSRWSLASELLASTRSYSVIDSPTPNLGPSHTAWIGKYPLELNQVQPVKPQLRYDDPTESHGPYLLSRGLHHVTLPRTFRISKFLITNRLYAEFVNANGYEQDALWSVPRRLRGQFFTSDRDTLGPGGWPGHTGFAAGEEECPVSEISFIEVWAFVRWLNKQYPAEPGWQWTLPSEDLWEYAARGEAGLIYPWGDVFKAGNCNSQESGIGHATEGSRFELALSPSGCADMAGNLWEFVSAYDGDSNFCTLRGGSYSNNSSEIRNYLRLIRVPPLHRAPDFGFRLAQTQEGGGDSRPTA